MTYVRHSPDNTIEPLFKIPDEEILALWKPLVPFEFRPGKRTEYLGPQVWTQALRLDSSDRALRRRRRRQEEYAEACTPQEDGDETILRLFSDGLKVGDIVASPDTFEKSITVYTYEGGEILEKFCEEPEWPNVTHDGDMMYENTFSTDRDYIVENAKRDAEARITLGQESLAEAERRVSEVKDRLEQARADLEKLNKL